MTDVSAIRKALADALKVIPGLQASPFLLSSPTPPCAQVTRGPIQYDLAMNGGVHRPNFTVTAYVALASDIGAQQLLDRYIAPTGTYSIKQALEADRSLGGLVSYLHVTAASGEQPYNRENGGPVLGSDWTVEVWI